MTAEQLSAFDKEIPKQMYIRKVERILYEYPALKAGQENEHELEQIGLGNLFPTLIGSYDDMPRGTDISDPTGKYGIKRAEKSIKIRQIERALDALNYEERKVIEEKYFNAAHPKDVQVYTELGLGSTYYYRVKDQAIRKVAMALNII